jgi:UDP-4-amino-4,6-dideoxy-N-acetyl-beta-L-altrosamine transaminase
MIIPYGRQDISQADIDAVVAVLRSDWLTQGPVVPQFERSLANYCGGKYAVAVSSATSALHLACLALGVGPGDIGWTVPNTFVASANCLRYCGANVDFVDIEPYSLNIDLVALEGRLRAARRESKLPKVLIPVHFAGRSCDMKAIRTLADEYGFHIIEDASHAVGAGYAGQRVGNCAYSDLTVFSFHPVKIMTTGEGGMITGNDAEVLDRIARLRSHGITREPTEMTAASEGGWYYEQLELGHNYRMTDIQAALGISQLGRLDEFLKKRRFLAARYASLLDGLPLRRPEPSDESAWHLYVISLHDAERRRNIFDGMRNKGIMVNVHYMPIHLQPYYRQLGFAAGMFPEAESYYAGAITLPLHALLREEEQDFVVETLRGLLV